MNPEEQNLDNITPDMCEPIEGPDGTHYLYNGQEVPYLFEPFEFLDNDEDEEEDSEDIDEDREDESEEESEETDEDEEENSNPDEEKPEENEGDEEPERSEEEGPEPPEENPEPNDIEGAEGAEGAEAAEAAEGAEAAAGAAETAEAAEAAAGAAEAAEGVEVLATAEVWGPIALIIIVVVVIILIVVFLFIGARKDQAYGDPAPSCTGGSVIVIDPGHPSEDSNSNTQDDYDRDEKNGTGATGGEGFGVIEREINQQVASKLKVSLEKKGYTVYLTKTDANKFMSNRARGVFVRDKKATLYIRIHNDDGAGSPEGIVFYYPDVKGYNPPASTKNELGEYPFKFNDEVVKKEVELAKKLNESFAKSGIKYGDGKAYQHQVKSIPKAFGYTYDTTTSLIEMSSLQYPKDAGFIKDPKNQDRLVASFVEGIENYSPPGSTGSTCGPGINGLESPPGMRGPNPKNYYLFPKGLKETGILYGAGNTECNHWGSKELNQVVYTVAKAFAAKYPKNKMQIGDFNSSRHETHNDGRDADIDIPGGMMNDGSSYNRELAIEAAKLYFQTKTIKWIYYDDATVVEKINSWAKENNLPGAMKAIGGHDDHFHVRMQDKYAGQQDTPSCP
jgi:N-acetylmuramoyl-L-alanine amidase